MLDITKVWGHYPQINAWGHSERVEKLDVITFLVYLQSFFFLLPLVAVCSSICY